MSEKIDRTAEAGTELSFEEALARLEKVVRELEGGNEKLDRSLELFEEGKALVKRCEDALNQAEQRVLRVVKTEDGKTATEDF